MDFVAFGRSLRQLQNNDSGLSGTWQLYGAELSLGENGKHSFSKQARLKQAVKKAPCIVSLTTEPTRRSKEKMNTKPAVLNTRKIRPNF